MRRLWLVLVCAVLVFASSSAAGERAVDRGIVMRVQAPRLAIRELDGSRKRFVINRATVVTLDGRRVRLVRLRRGDVAAIEHARRFVRAVRALRP
jgi:hypothetical protein